jgi:DNA helicase-2/ATP-dependent DNA helicase PcrA
MAVGDDDQSIFAFNGAELNNMLGFRRTYPDTKLIVLEDNYRSVQPILDTAKQIIEQAEDRLVKREEGITKNLKASRPPTGKVDIQHFSYPTRAHQFSAVAGRIKELWEKGETDIAVLARKHDSLKQLASILLRQGVAVRYDRRSNVLEHEAVRQAYQIAQLAVAIAAGDKPAVNAGLAGLLRHPMWALSPASLWKLATTNYSSPDWLDSLLDSDDKKLVDIGNWMTWLARLSHDQPLPLVLEYILGLSEGKYLQSPFRDYYLTLQPTSSQYLETLSAVELLRGLAKEFSSREATLADFVRFIELNLSTERVIADESWFMSGEQAVELLTVYKAKGLEFDHVFVVDATEAMWRPRTGGRGSPANLQLQSYGEKYDDYIRLLYVAATRARRAFIASSYFSDDRGNELLPTPLLSALPFTVINEPREEPVEVLENDLRWPSLSSQNEKALLQDRLERYSLSSTDLMDFLNLAEAGPQSFKERRILRLPTPRSPIGSYGTAIHAALETAQRLINTSKLELGTVLDRFEATLRDEHLAAIDYKRYRLRGEELLSKLLTKDQALILKDGLAEQRLTDITLEKARIKGTLDRIDIEGDVLTISDYKTGKPLTSFDTKDQTKLVKAWRHRLQLQFYALLVGQSARFKKAGIIRAQMLYVEAEQTSQIALGLNPAPQELDRLRRLIEAVWRHVIDLNFPDTNGYSQDASGIEQFENDLIDGKI